MGLLAPLRLMRLANGALDGAPLDLLLAILPSL